MNKYYSINQKSFTELGVTTHKELWEKVKGEYAGLCADIHAEFTKAEDKPNKFTVIMSSDNEDRHGDIVEQNWDLRAFKKNPVFLDSHNYGSIEHIIGKFTKVWVEDGKLKGNIEFMLDNPKGMLAFKMAEQGFLNATSVGFIPKEFDDKGRILKSELLENSAVSVPANADALFEKGIKEVIEDVELPEVTPTEPEVVIEEELEEDIDPVEEVIAGAEEVLEDTLTEDMLKYIKEKKEKKKKELETLLSSLKQSPYEEKRKILKEIRKALF